MSSASNSKTAVVGKPIDRVDGRLKVTGQAKYAAEHVVPNLVYAYCIQSPVPRATIKEIDTSNAERLPGVMAIYSCKNKPMLLPKNGGERGSQLFLLQDDKIHYAGQIIGLAVADTAETARYAAELVKVSYNTQPFDTDMRNHIDDAVHPKSEKEEERGDIDKGLNESAIKIEALYSTPKESHNPMEPFATIASWKGDSLTLYESTQGVHTSKRAVSAIFDIPPEKVRVITPFVGGGFGCKLLVWAHSPLAAMAAKKLNRPVKVVLARPQMYGPVGFRPATVQRIQLGATKEGKLLALSHESINENCRYLNFVETVTEASKMLYASANVYADQKVALLDIGQPTWMRAPGHAPGSFALECAMDELAYACNLDPIELRVRNYADKDYDQNLPWSHNSLLQCYKEGAERFGWGKRNPKPGSMKEGRLLVGYGMATATHGTYRTAASARVELRPDGTAIVQTGSQDIGTGTYTIMTQIAAEKLALPMNKVTMQLGDSDLPPAPMSGGSMTAGNVGAAVARACMEAIDKLIDAARADKKSPLAGAQKADIEARDGALVLKSHASTKESFASIIAKLPNRKLIVTVDNQPDDNEKKYSMHTFGAQFCEVKIDPDLGTLQVSRFGGSYGAGRILNAKTARSQMLGGITFGIGMALLEHTMMDHRYGKVLNADLAEYHLPVNRDVGDIDVHFLEEEDTLVNVIGAKGVGELGITGVAAAIANAVYHATGKRIRELPITLDKLI